jgi:hypothetical protein
MARRYTEYIGSPEQSMGIIRGRQIAKVQAMEDEQRAIQKEADRAWQQQKFDEQTAFQREQAQMAENRWIAEQTAKAAEDNRQRGLMDQTRPLTLEAQALANEKARLEVKRMKNPLPDVDIAKKIRPADRAKYVQQFWQDFEIKPDDTKLLAAYAENPAAVNEVILDGIAQGWTTGEIASSLGAGVRQKPSMEKSFWGRPKPLRDPVDPNRVIPFRSILGDQEQPAMAQPTAPAQPTESPELTQARYLYADYQRRSVENPNWVDSAPPKELERMMQIVTMVEQADAQPRGIIAPTVQPQVQGQPQQMGRIVSEQELVDANQDGTIDQRDERIATQYKNALALVEGFQAYRKQGGQLSDDDLATMRRAEIFAKKHDKVLGGHYEKMFAAQAR